MSHVDTMIDRSAESIKRCKRSVAAAYAASEELRERLDEA